MGKKRRKFMKIQYLGTGAAEGVPAVFCNCETCRAARRLGGKEIRTRSQVVIDGILGIDFPPDAYYHSLQFGVDLSALQNLLVTHSHMDHFYAHDFILRGYKYAGVMTSPTLHIYGNAAVNEVFSECTRRELRADIAEHITLSELQLFTEYTVGGYIVTPFPAVHSKEEQALVYLVERGGKAYLHLCDTGKLTEETFAYLKEKGKRVNLVTLDCTLLDKDYSNSGRHMGLTENKKVMERLLSDGVADRETKFVITHFSHNAAPLSERIKPLEEAYGVTAAYDGMTVEI
jgi:phosphoribosyl 1,2-cyclic phosphate phosphodiesterase